MKSFLIFTSVLALAIAENVKPQTRAMGFTYPAQSTAAYPPGTGIIYNKGTQLKYPAGTVAIYMAPLTSVQFNGDSEFYTSKGTVAAVGGSVFNFTQGLQVAYPPGTQLTVMSSGADTKYGQFNGNTHTIVQYLETTPAQYYTGQNTNLVLFQPGTNPLVYYNPGGTTQFGVSALPVEKEVVITARTYGYYGGGGGYSYCGGYNYNGYPRTNYCNYNTGYTSYCQANGGGSYSYGTGGGGGGYSMSGGSCYGGGSYYGGGGGGGGGYGK